MTPSGTRSGRSDPLSFPGSPLSRRPEMTLLLRRHGAQIGHDRVEVGRRHVLVELKAHRRLQARAVLADPVGDRALDLVVAPRADALFLVRGDVDRKSVV